MFYIEYVNKIEKQAMEEMLAIAPINTYSDQFINRAMTVFPNQFNHMIKKKKGRPSKATFIKDVGEYLWNKWNINKTEENQNNIVMYLCHIIYGRLPRMTRWGDLYDDCFNNLIVSAIKNLGTYDPSIIVKYDENNNPVYTTVYTYFYMRFGYDIQGMDAMLTKYHIDTPSFDDYVASDKSKETFEEYILRMINDVEDIEDTRDIFDREDRESNKDTSDPYYMFNGIDDDSC